MTFKELNLFIPSCSQFGPVFTDMFLETYY